MGIDMIEQKNGEQIFEYKFPGFINETNILGNSSDDYEILQVLGKGSFGGVLKVKSKTTFGIYAMKRVNMEYILETQKTQKYFENEVIILQHFNDQNVCKCYNIFQDENYLYFIMEFMNNGDLYSFYKTNKLFKIQIPEEKLWNIFYKCLSGLVYIHEQGIIHRDIKLENIFLDDDLNIKIGDFNVSVAVDENAAKNFVQEKDKVLNMLNEITEVGTDGYMAPEIKRQSQYGQNVDVYSMGIAFFELCYWCKPSDELVIKEDYYKKNIYSKELNDFIDKMIQNNENKRITSSQACSIAKKFFIQKFVRNSSIDAVLNCFNNFPNFNEYYCFENNKFFLTNYKKEVCKGVYNVIQSLKGNNRDIIDNELYELRKSMVKTGLNIKNDNEEIDPAILISFLINKLNSDLNEIESSNNNNINNSNAGQYMILSSSFKFPKNISENIFNNFINSYNNRIFSLISRNFFSVVITKKECMNCGNSGNFFSMFYFIHLNIDILSKKCQNKLTLKNAFGTFINDQIILKVDKNIKCDNCKVVTQHKESKKFYHMGKNLIIIFDRGENSKNKQFVDFDEKIILNKTEVERYNEVEYQLLGIIIKIKNEIIKKKSIYLLLKMEIMNGFQIKEKLLILKILKI